MQRISRFVVWVGLLCLADVTRVAADPVSITSGFFLVTADEFELGSISISGTQGFSLNAGVTVREGRVDVFELECNPICLPGSTISLGAFQGGPSFVGAATLRGTSYQLSGNLDDPATVSVEFVARATLPALQNALLLETPFNAMGWFTPPSGEQVLMRGAGVVSLWLSPSTNPDVPPGWSVAQIRYDFRDTAPVPEPATLSLLGIGLAAAALRARRRGRANASQA